ncbi:expressed unknown protein [Seminavis robusta]|uniref:Uncharacterized protein n=1 Tax=Seminavis robusta TaxID=568900 RepID=A0A9N8H196_9STRA|nr:expressed unknown protein [Seminavis robusta]|eukprot:Sro36_g022701.1  (246) ;mRNA; r:24861-25598
MEEPGTLSSCAIGLCFLVFLLGLTDAQVDTGSIEVIIPSLFLGVNVTQELVVTECREEWLDMFGCLLQDCANFDQECSLTSPNATTGATGALPDCLHAKQNYCLLVDGPDCCMSECENEIFDAASCAAEALGGEGYEACTAPTNCTALEEEEMEPFCSGSPTACEDLFETEICGNDCFATISQCALTCASASSTCECTSNSNCNLPGSSTCKEVSCTGSAPLCRDLATQEDCLGVARCKWSTNPQ